MLLSVFGIRLKVSSLHEELDVWASESGGHKLISVSAEMPVVWEDELSLLASRGGTLMEQSWEAERSCGSGERHLDSLIPGCIWVASGHCLSPSGVLLVTPDPEWCWGSIWVSFFTSEAGEGRGPQRELWDGSLLENPKLVLSTRFTLTTHICLQGPVEDKKMDECENDHQVNKHVKIFFIDLSRETFPKYLK